LKKDSPRVQ
jgi:hypothetical protein